MSQIESGRPKRRRSERHPTGAQLRAARALLNMSIKELAEQTGLAVNTIVRAEETNDPAPIHAANANLLVTTFEAGGVRFIPPADGLGAGARLIDPHQPLAFKRRRLTKGG